MVRISTSYSIQEFEEDSKANITKCATQMKCENRQIIENEEEEKPKEIEKEKEEDDAKGQIEHDTNCA